MNEQKISIGTRLGTMLLDHIFMSFIAMIFAIPEFVYNLVQNLDSTPGQLNYDLFPGDNYLGLIGFALYFCKDSISGRSLAKRILKLHVVDNLTGKAASPFQCFIRNVFCVLWPIEVIVSLINPERRIGDWVARTKLVPFDKEKEQEQSSPRYLQIAIVFILSYTAMNLLWTQLKSFNQIDNMSNSSQDLYYQQSK